MKKFNSGTGCYKIDVYVDGGYFWSTDWSKTCKDAREKTIKHLNEHNIAFEKVSVHFDKILKLISCNPQNTKITRKGWKNNNK